MRPFLVPVLLVLSVPLAAQACRCVPPTPKVAYQRATVVVEAEVTSVSVADADGAITAVLQVVHAWKSAVPQTVTVHTGAECTFPLTTGKQYVLFLKQGRSGWFYTERCAGNEVSEESSEVKHWLEAHAHAVALLPPEK